MPVNLLFRDPGPSTYEAEILDVHSQYMFCESSGAVFWRFTEEHFSMRKEPLTIVSTKESILTVDHEDSRLFLSNDLHC